MRWRHFSYASVRLYYVTIVVQGRRCLFGACVDGELVLTPGGQLAQDTWLRLPLRFRGVRLDAFVVMPNHVHGIVGFTERRAEARYGRDLGELMAWFKTQTTRGYTHGVRERRWPRFHGRLWQRNYYDRVIRDDQELAHARGYIARNPARWAFDPENPDRISEDRATKGDH